MKYYRQIFEKYSNVKLYENCLVVAELFRADGRTDVTKIVVAFCGFANAPEMELYEVKSNPTNCKSFNTNAQTRYTCHTDRKLAERPCTLISQTRCKIVTQYGPVPLLV